jgi:hypothetical protein
MQVIELYNVRISTHAEDVYRVDINIINEDGDVIEGGEFDKRLLLKAIMGFYNENY